MDNVTHSLAGLVVAEAAGQLRRARTGRTPSAAFRTAAAVAGVVAANLPDGDLLYTSLAADRLAYLLHHRGYTHTLLVAAIGVLLTWAATLAVWRWRARRDGAGPEPADGRWLLALIAVAVLSHLALDATNDYGVHPFWPVDDRWRYGDAVFIVEPWLWVAAVPPLLFAAQRPATRGVLAVVLAAALLLAWLVALVPWGAALALTVGAVVAVAVARRLGPAARPAVAIGGWLVVELVFAAGTGAARRALVASATATDPAARLADVVVTPAPANPFCVSALVVETAGAGGARYRVTTAWAAAVPSVLPAARCAGTGTTRRGNAVTAVAMRPSPRPSGRAVRWDRSWEAPRAELVALARGNCQVAAFLRFARVPFWRRLGGDTLRVGDLRYARGPDLGFADLVTTDRPASCPRGVPPWQPPRAALLVDPPAP